MHIGSDNMDATRCELAGLYKILRIIECIVKVCEVEEGNIEKECDYEGGLKRALLR